MARGATDVFESIVARINYCHQLWGLGLGGPGTGLADGHPQLSWWGDCTVCPHRYLLWIQLLRPLC